MKKYVTADLKNVCLVGSGHTGKTSLAEAIFFDTGITARLGTVEQGTTLCDYNKEETERKISINASLAFFEYNQKKINLIDTPGYADFIGEVVSSLHVVDTVIIVIDAVSGLKTQIDNILEYIEKEKIPFIIFINKLDKEMADFDKILSELKEKFGTSITPLQLPIGKENDFCGIVDLIKMEEVRFESGSGKSNQKALSDEFKGEAEKLRDAMIEVIASSDDSLTEKYLEGQAIEENEIKEKLKEGIIERKIIPVLCGSALKNVGIKSLLETMINYFPAPNERKSEVPIDSSAPFSALVFKTISEQHTGALSFFKVCSGKVSTGKDVYNWTKEHKERIGQLCFLQGKKHIETAEVEAGDITCVAKLKVTASGDTLGEGKTSVLIKSPEFPEPVMRLAVYSKSKGDEEKVASALSAIMNEDKTIKFSFDAETKEMIIAGIGDLQLEVIKSRVKSKYGVELEFRAPRIAYKETIAGNASVQGKYKKQSGGRGQYGDCWLKIEPLERGKGFEFINKIVGGAIPRNYIPSVEKGVREAMEKGVLAGYPVVDIKVTLFDGSYHDVDSSDMAFKIAGAMAFQKGIKEAKPFILEPIMESEVSVPDVYTGSIMGDLNSRRGRVLGMEKTKNKKEKIKVNVPLSELSKYAVDLRSLTKGSGKYRMRFSHYEQTPSPVSQTLVETFQKAREEGR